jgi:hypothetical protein
MQSALDGKRRTMENIALLANERLRNSRQELDGYDVRMWSRLLASRIGSARAALCSGEMGMGHTASVKLSRAKEQLASLDSGLRTTWVAAMAENGLAALYQDGRRVRDASEFRKGEFRGLMRGGKITGEVKDIEV